MNQRIDRISFIAFAALLALAPLPFASNRMWAWSLISLVTGALLVAWAVAALLRPNPDTVPFRRYAPALIAFALAVAWAFAQAMPWLPGIAAHPLWDAAASALGGTSPHAAISLDPGATLTGAIRLSTYSAVFWLALQHCRDADRAHRLLWVFVLAGALYALYGLIVEFTGLDMILWYQKWAYRNSLTATFVNRNNFATYAGMVAIAAVALLAHEIEHAITRSGTILGSIVDTIDALPARAYALIGCLIVTGTAILLTQSRAGIAATAAGTAIFLIAHGIYRRRRNGMAGVFAGTIMLVLLTLMLISGQGVLNRMISVENDLSGRSTVWALTREASTERPLVGSGIGTFSDVYRAGRDERLPSNTPLIEHAHNSYLENLLELGLPATVLLVGALVWLGLWCALGVMVRHRHGVFACVALGALGLNAIHALFDFSLEIPAVTLSLAALLGAGCAQADRSTKV